MPNGGAISLKLGYIELLYSTMAGCKIETLVIKDHLNFGKIVLHADQDGGKNVKDIITELCKLMMFIPEINCILCNKAINLPNENCRSHPVA